MPTYQYACTDPECGNRFELVQSFTDPAASECPVCQHAVRKVYGSVGVVFKGSGFYRNDSRAAAKTSDGPSSAGDSAKSESKSEAKSEPKSESKSDSKSSSTKADTKSSSAAASA
jgi:putative FmdB family regulatory protein